jgi:hypothetical protein
MVVLTNPDDCSPAAVSAFLDEPLNKPEPELDSLHAAETLRELRTHICRRGYRRWQQRRCLCPEGLTNRGGIGVEMAPLRSGTVMVGRGMVRRRSSATGRPCWRM